MFPFDISSKEKYFFSDFFILQLHLFQMRKLFDIFYTDFYILFIVVVSP